MDPGDAASTANAPARSGARVVAKPAFVDVIEDKIAAAVPLHPNTLSLLKLVALPPLLWGLAHSLVVAVVAFVVFAAIDAVDGVVAQKRGLATPLGRVLDRATDLPFLVALLWSCRDVLPLSLLVAKLALDGLLVLLFVLKRASSENRIRTTLADASLLALVVLAQQPGVDALVTKDVAAWLLGVNIAFSAFVGLVNTGVLQARFIADGLSALNGVCGLVGIYWALPVDGHESQPAFCLLLLLLGAGFDGLDGAAARRWGGTRFGVLADDIADGVSYALAPAVAVGVVVDGVAGVVIGVAYAVFTISRLVYFTLNKGSAGDDPRYFRGVPSTIGGMVALCACILFAHEPALVGFLVGVACVLMVGFDSAYRHLGRVLFGLRRERQIAAAVAALVLVLVSAALGARVGAGVLLGVSLVYGFLPQISRFLGAIAQKTQQASSSTSGSSPPSPGSDPS